MNLEQFEYIEGLWFQLKIYMQDQVRDVEHHEELAVSVLLPIHAFDGDVFVALMAQVKHRELLGILLAVQKLYREEVPNVHAAVDAAFFVLLFHLYFLHTIVQRENESDTC